MDYQGFSHDGVDGACWYDGTIGGEPSVPASGDDGGAVILSGVGNGIIRWESAHDGGDYTVPAAFTRDTTSQRPDSREEHGFAGSRLTGDDGHSLIELHVSAFDGSDIRDVQFLQHAIMIP